MKTYTVGHSGDLGSFREIGDVKVFSDLVAGSLEDNGLTVDDHNTRQLTEVVAKMLTQDIETYNAFGIELTSEIDTEHGMAHVVDNHRVVLGNKFYE